MNKNPIKFMQHAVKIALKIALKNPSAPYGTIIVYDECEIVAECVNESHVNPILYGEIAAINSLFENGFEQDINKLSLYTTAEPCPMCASVIYWSMIPNVFYRSSIPFLNMLFGRQIQIRASEIFSKTPNFYTYNLHGGLLEEECNSLFINALNIRKNCVGEML